MALMRVYASLSARIMCAIITSIKTTDEFMNVGDAALGRDAYVMSHLSAEDCTQWLAAGRGDGYQVMGISLQLLW